MKHLFLICLALIAAPQAVLGKIVNVYSIGDWSVVVHADDRSGRLGPCIATTKYQTGTILGFSVSPQNNGTWSILFGNPRWNLTTGAAVNLRYWIDNNLFKEASGSALAPEVVLFPLPGQISLINEFRQGKMLFISTGNGGVAQFALTNTSQILFDLLACAKDSLDGRVHVPTANMFSNQNRGHTGPVPAAATAAPTAESRLEAVTLATNVLAAAGISSFHFLSGDEIPESVRIHDAVWTVNGLVGSLRVLADGRAMTTVTIKAGLLAWDSSICTGKFASGILPMQKDRPDSFAIFTACEDQHTWSESYIVVPRKRGGHYLFTIAGQGKSEDAVKSAGNLFRQAVFQVLPGE